MFEFETKRSVFGNMEYPIILCEDNPEQLANLTSIINDFNMFHPNQYKLAFKSSDPHAIEEYIKENSVEKGVYFLDIDLGSDINGIDLAQWVRNHDISGKIIFITTHTEMAPLTLQRQVEPLGFITKDMGYEQMRIEIVDTLNLAYERIEKKALENDKMYSFSIGNQVLNFEEKKIIYITSSDKAHRVILVTQDGQYEFFDNIANLEVSNESKKNKSHCETRYLWISWITSNSFAVSDWVYFDHRVTRNVMALFNECESVI